MATLKEKLRDGKIVVGPTLTECLRPSLAKIFSNLGFDFLFLEFEHCLFNPRDLTDVMITCKDNDLPVISKVPSLERAWTVKLLDAGATGIQLPPTRTRADIDELVRLMKYPPIGDRPGCPGMGNTNFVWIDGPDMIEQGNALTTVVAHIETADGLENIEEIVECEELDVVFVGTYDLSIALGDPGEMESPRVVEAVRRIVAASKAKGKTIGTGAFDMESAKMWIDEGLQLFEVTSELGLITDGARRLLDGFRKGTGG